MMTTTLQGRLRADYKLMAALHVNGCFHCPVHAARFSEDDGPSFCTCIGAKAVAAQSLSHQIEAKYVFVQQWEATLLARDEVPPSSSSDEDESEWLLVRLSSRSPEEIAVEFLEVSHVIKYQNLRDQTILTSL